MIRQSIPSALSITRAGIALLVPIVYPSRCTVVLFVLACLTDFLDGTLARMWGVISPVGAILDQAADKMFVFFVILTLGFHGKLPLWFCISIALRESLVSLAFIKISMGGLIPKTNIMGKLHICVQFSILFFAMWYRIPNMILYSAIAISIAPMFIYLNQIKK